MRLRHAGPIVFELEPGRPTGVACSRLDGHGPARDQRMRWKRLLDSALSENCRRCRHVLAQRPIPSTCRLCPKCPDRRKRQIARIDGVLRSGPSLPLRHAGATAHGVDDNARPALPCSGLVSLRHFETSGFRFMLGFQPGPRSRISIL